MRKCLQCGAEFVPENDGHVFCPVVPMNAHESWPFNGSCYAIFRRQHGASNVGLRIGRKADEAERRVEAAIVELLAREESADVSQ